MSPETLAKYILWRMGTLSSPIVMTDDDLTHVCLDGWIDMVTLSKSILTRVERERQVRELARPYGLANANWNLWETHPRPHQCVVIVGEFVHGKPVLEAAQYDGINFFGGFGGRHNQNVWAWLDALVASDTRHSLGSLLQDLPDGVMKDLPHLLQQFRPKGS